VSTAAPSAPLRVIRRRARPLIRSAGIRFALLYAVVFGASAFALAFSLWYSTVGLLERQVSIAIRNDATALDEHYELGGLPALIGALRDRLADNADNDDIYLLQDSLGNRIIGNLSRWPPQVTDTDTLQEVPIVIGKNTVANMQSGIFWGYVGLIESLIKRIRDEYGEPMKVADAATRTGELSMEREAIGAQSQAGRR